MRWTNRLIVVCKAMFLASPAFSQYLYCTSVHQFTMMNPHASSLSLLTGTLLILSAAIQLTFANKTVPCDKTGCNSDQFCDLTTGKCRPDYGDCRVTLCGPGFYCSDYGKCIKDTPCDTPVECPAGEECFMEQLDCIQAPCPPIQSCRPVKCPEGCQDGEMCENGECVLDSRCALVLCAEDTICYKGACFKRVDCEGETSKDGLPQKCYEGSEECSEPPCPKKIVRRSDKCAVVRCSSGHHCVDGRCVKDSSQKL